jgi:hypothetical protein
MRELPTCRGLARSRTHRLYGDPSNHAPAIRPTYAVRVVNRLTPDQQAAFDGGPAIDRRLQSSGKQTPTQARNFAIHDFRVRCDFDGRDVPSVEAVEAAIDAALVASAGDGSIHSDVLPRTEFRDIDGAVVAVATVGDDGAAVTSGSAARTANIAATRVIAPLKTGPRIVEPADGELYLRALPAAFRGPYLRAVFVGRSQESQSARRSAGVVTESTSA